MMMFFVTMIQLYKYRWGARGVIIYLVEMVTS
jgi:hypothetical protein